MEWPSSSSSKREREREREKGVSNGEVVNCLVDGCNADLRVCREYHRRHKVCEAHSKTPKVSISGRELRFCQQCSRFQSLVEFDEGKRSCRKRLDRHNRRRRKPQPQNPGLHFSNQPPGPTLVSFGSPQMVPTSWAGGAVNEVEYEQGMYSGDGGLFDSNGALSLLSTREVDFNLPWVLQTKLAHQETGNSVASSAPSTLHAQGSSSGGSHQTFTFTWE